MRIRIIFSLINKGAVLPFHHQKLIRILINEILGNDQKVLGKELFNFSGLKGQTKVGHEGLHYYSKRVTLVFSSFKKSFAELFIQKLFLHDRVALGNLILVPELVEEEILPDLQSSNKYLCISPLVVLNQHNNDRNKEFIHPTTDDFSDLLYESTMTRMEETGKYSNEDIASFFRFQLIPDKIYLNKINKAEKKFARIYTLVDNKSIKEVRGYTFPFSLYAAPEVQEFIFKCGFGELTSHGFGMVDFSHPSNSNRQVIYTRKSKFIHSNNYIKES
ncbi:CRISPR-associated endoribonuclease Cas6 [Rapidithrix thailandica]|uniref:CRISPR-associated endoribonuclease Cas6 n=1 Tax=Rapidithrix thailandica TaxID=413964 RepID=A0AAW9SBG8_9BACT